MSAIDFEGRALLGAMTAEIHRLPVAGEETIVLAWPLAREGRKQVSGVALYATDGELMALAHQVWIAMGPRPQPAVGAGASASA